MGTPIFAGPWWYLLYTLHIQENQPHQSSSCKVSPNLLELRKTQKHVSVSSSVYSVIHEAYCQCRKLILSYTYTYPPLFLRNLPQWWLHSSLRTQLPLAFILYSVPHRQQILEKAYGNDTGQLIKINSANVMEREDIIFWNVQMFKAMQLMFNVYKKKLYWLIGC